MRDFILAIRGDEDSIQARLFLTACTGSLSADGVVEAYFDTAEDRDAAMELLGGFDTRTVERERIDWLERYEQSLKAMTIGDRFIVAPDASLLPDGGERLTIVVPQEQAFGTGSHETTSLCIELLETLDVQGKRGLDIGAGSGILAIAMLRLGASKVIAFDNDVDAYAALRENRERNGIGAACMPLFIGTLDALRGGTFDVITMNIVPEVIVPMLDDVMKRAGGAIIVSGVLAARRDEIPLRMTTEKTKGEWWAGVFAG